MDCAPICGLWMSLVALALMVIRALGRHPRSGFVLNLGRYRVPRVAVGPVCHHVSVRAASGELFSLLCRRTVLSIMKRTLRRPLILFPASQQRPQNAGMFRR
jgi:hypothetical protein